MTLGQRFKHLRCSRSVTQEQLADLAKIGRSTVSALENGETLKLDTLRIMAAPLKLSDAEWLALVVDWIHQEVGSDFPKLTISTRTSDTSHFIKTVSEVFYALPAKAQGEVLKLLRRPHAAEAITLVNKLYDELASP